VVVAVECEPLPQPMEMHVAKAEARNNEDFRMAIQESLSLWNWEPHILYSDRFIVCACGHRWV
jgi:hypothetical protein